MLLHNLKQRRFGQKDFALTVHSGSIEKVAE
jgi:hypothetical protein